MKRLLALIAALALLGAMLAVPAAASAADGTATVTSAGTCTVQFGGGTWTNTDPANVSRPTSGDYAGDVICHLTGTPLALKPYRLGTNCTDDARTYAYFAIKSDRAGNMTLVCFDTWIPGVPD